MTVWIMRLALLTGLLAGPIEAPSAATLTVRVEALKRSGDLVLAFFSSEANWNANANPVTTSRTPITSDGSVAVTTSLPAGEYAIMAFHDVNGDGILNTSLIGLPTEPYAFSNNARGLFGPARWKTARFQLQTDAVLTLRLH